MQLTETQKEAIKAIVNNRLKELQKDIYRLQSEIEDIDGILQQLEEMESDMILKKEEVVNMVKVKAEIVKKGISVTPMAKETGVDFSRIEEIVLGDRSLNANGTFKKQDRPAAIYSNKQYS